MGAVSSDGVLIVGGGLAGLEVAHQLAKLEVPVTVVERGRDFRTGHISWELGPEEALNLWLQPSTDEAFWRPWSTTTPPHFDGVSCLRSRLGGRSLYWHGVVLRVADRILRDHWPASVASELMCSFQDGPSLYERVLAELVVWGPRPNRSVPPPSVSLGPYCLQLVPRAIQSHPTLPRRWRAYSPLDRLVRDSPSHVTVLEATQALRLLCDASGVHGALVSDSRGKEREVLSPKVVLAAGAIVNGALVAAIREDPTSCALRPSGPTDHLVQGFTARIDSNEMIDGIYYMPLSDDEVSSQEDANLFIELSSSDDGRVMEVWVCSEQVQSRQSELRVTEGIGGTDLPYGIELSASLSSRDLREVARQRDVLQDVWNHLARALGVAASRLSFAEFGSQHSGVPDGNKRAALAPREPAPWASPLGTEQHEGCNLRLGEELTGDAAVRGRSGLYVAGPSTFPRMGAANPALTTLALAMRLAHHLKGVST